MIVRKTCGAPHTDEQVKLCSSWDGKGKLSIYFCTKAVYGWSVGNTNYHITKWQLLKFAVSSLWK